VLDKDKRLIQSMRTFIQASPGVTRSCIGCHEQKSMAPEPVNFSKTDALNDEQSVLKPESWGTGYMDYPSLIQPVWDRHCIDCHGGKSGFAGRLDLTGGWTEHFNISYENLVDRRETQLVPYLIDGIDCMNGTAHYSVPLFKPRSFGSATAPLAKAIVGGHEGRIKGMTDVERDLVMAWIDSNGLYYGSWDYTPITSVRSWADTSNKLGAVMQKANCTACHDKTITSDWFNLQTPEYSRILRAPLAKGDSGNGLAICRNHKADPLRARIKMMRTGRYEHAVLPLESFAKVPVPPIQPGGTEHITFAATNDPNYQEMLAIIKAGRESALLNPRIDMPGAAASIIAGQCRMLVPPAVPNAAPALKASPGTDRSLLLSWDRTAYTIGLLAEVHRGGAADFKPGANTRLCSTELGHFIDKDPQPGQPYYALVITGPENEPSSPSYITVRATSSQ
jgi:cytochrome c553